MNKTNTSGLEFEVHSISARWEDEDLVTLTAWLDGFDASQRIKVEISAIWDGERHEYTSVGFEDCDQWISADLHRACERRGGAWQDAVEIVEQVIIDANHLKVGA